MPTPLTSIPNNQTPLTIGHSQKQHGSDENYFVKGLHSEVVIPTALQHMEACETVQQGNSMKVIQEMLSSQENNSVVGVDQKGNLDVDTTFLGRTFDAGEGMNEMNQTDKSGHIGPRQPVIVNS